jgi:hypothetical protein
MVIASVTSGIVVVLVGVLLWRHYRKKRRVRLDGDTWLTSISNFHKRASLKKK